MEVDFEIFTILLREWFYEGKFDQDMEGSYKVGDSLLSRRREELMREKKENVIMTARQAGTRYSLYLTNLKEGKKSRG